MIAFAPPPEPECCQQPPCGCSAPEPASFTVTISGVPDGEICECEAGALFDAMLAEMRRRGGQSKP